MKIAIYLPASKNTLQNHRPIERTCLLQSTKSHSELIPDILFHREMRIDVAFRIWTIPHFESLFLLPFSFFWLGSNCRNQIQSIPQCSGSLRTPAPPHRHWMEKKYLGPNLLLSIFPQHTGQERGVFFRLLIALPKRW